GYVEDGIFENILKELEIIEYKKILWTQENYQRLKDSIIENIKIYENKNPHSFSLPLKYLSGLLEIDLNEEVFQKIIEELNFNVVKGNLILKEKEELTEDLKKILKVLKDYGLATPDPDTLSKETGIPIKELKLKLRDLVQRGFLAQVSVGYYIEKEVLENAIKKLKSTGWEKFTISEFKELFDISRKYAVPLLEYLDSQRITVRTKDFRILKK
ncbi:MAG: SelB C-terminal domain-containing protein, partial [Thermoanaerobaculia bacterium]